MKGGKQSEKERKGEIEKEKGKSGSKRMWKKKERNIL